jgi:hypothetical protein
MFGNWETGSSRMLTMPTITMMIEMTIATIGRLMKKRDMGGGGAGYFAAVGVATGFAVSEAFSGAVST